MNKAAQKLGRMGKGKRKTITDAERERRRIALALVRVKRWAIKKEESNGLDC